MISLSIRFTSHYGKGTTMKNNNRVYIISAEVSGLSDLENAHRTDQLWGDIGALELKAKPSIGLYKGITEQSIVVVERSTDSLRDLLLSVSDEYSQECIMVREPSGSCYLLANGDSDLYIGEWREVPESIAKMATNSTMVDGKYYITSKFT